MFVRFPPEGKFTDYPRLDSVSRDAMGGGSPLYSQAFAEASKTYHGNGRNWEQDKLEKFFSDGLLQYYVGMVSGFDFDCQQPSSMPDTKHLNVRINLFPPTGERPTSPRVGIWNTFLFATLCLGPSMNKEKTDTITTQISPWIPVVSEIFSKIKSIPFLLKIGAEFQRLKQHNEHLQYAQNVNSRKPYSDVFENEREMEMLQTAIVWWVHDYVRQLKKFISDNNYNLEDVKSKLNEFVPNDPPFVDDLVLALPRLRPQPKAETKPVTQKPLPISALLKDDNESKSDSKPFIYEFDSRRLALSSPVACMLIGAKILAMSNESFIWFFKKNPEAKDKHTAEMYLTRWINDADELHTHISPGFFQRLSDKSSEEILTRIKDNYNKDEVGKISQMTSSSEIIGANPKDDNLPDLLSLFAKLDDKQSIDKMAFVFTVGNHSQLFFFRQFMPIGDHTIDSKENYSLVIMDPKDKNKSGIFSAKGTMKVYSDINVGIKELYKIWNANNNAYVDVTPITINDTITHQNVVSSSPTPKPV
jgi:hypothetical protein